MQKRVDALQGVASWRALEWLCRIVIIRQGGRGGLKGKGKKTKVMEEEDGGDGKNCTSDDLVVKKAHCIWH